MIPPRLQEPTGTFNIAENYSYHKVAVIIKFCFIMHLLQKSPDNIGMII